jgi:hypothetical protein
MVKDEFGSTIIRTGEQINDKREKSENGCYDAHPIENFIGWRLKRLFTLPALSLLNKLRKFLLVSKH